MTSDIQVPGVEQTGILTAVQGRVRFARACMGTYELIDFIVVLIG